MRIDTINLSDWLRRNAIGTLANIERNFDMHLAEKYPPHSILSLDESNYVLTLAVAGFAKNELKVEVENDSLTISGVKGNVEMPEGAKMIHQGISFRDFTRKWKLEDHMEVDKVSLEDGLLIIKLKINKPETKKTKVHDIL
jgi:molecular chaperone IbpA